MAGAGSKNNKVGRYGRIGVLAGGPSSEREISLKSGKAVYEALKKAGCDVILLDVSDQFEKDIRKSKIAVAFIALHGRFGEDGTVQKMLDQMRVPYTGSAPLASQLALDKIASRREFERVGIPTPEYRVVEKDSQKLVDLNFPIVVKPQLEGSSIGLSIVDEESRYLLALNEAYKYGSRVVVEEFIKGREITVGILDDQPLPPVEIIPAGRCYDFFAKYESPDTQYIAPAPIKHSHYKKAQRLALLAHKALNCESFSRVDMILGDNARFYVLEVNSIPGLTTRSLLPKAARAVGISFQNLCIKILEGALKKDRRRQWINKRKKVRHQKR